MTRYVGFLRAINVAGHARVKIRDVREVFRAAGAANATSYLQSGNIVFDADPRDVSILADRAGRELGKRLGETPEILVRTMSRLAELAERSPFGGMQPSATLKLYVTFLSRKPRRRLSFPLVSRVEALEVLGIEEREVFLTSHPKPNGFFGFPNNFVEKELGVVATTRNWSTITKLVDFAGERGQPVEQSPIPPNPYRK